MARSYPLRIEKMDSWPTPGENIRALFDRFGYTPSQVARHIGLAPSVLRMVVLGFTRVTADLSIRLSKAFGVKPSYFMTLQQNYDLWKAYRDFARFGMLPKTIPRLERKAPKQSRKKG